MLPCAAILPRGGLQGNPTGLAAEFWKASGMPDRSLGGRLAIRAKQFPRKAKSPRALVGQRGSTENLIAVRSFPSISTSTK